jgi:hypothetical protein
MKYVIVGLGNPGEEYVHTRHNAGHIIVAELAKRDLNAKLVPLESMMNNSGTAVAVFVKNQKEAEKLVVIHDDLDLPLGAIKLSFGRGAGGHRGVVHHGDAHAPQEQRQGRPPMRISSKWIALLAVSALSLVALTNNLRPVMVVQAPTTQEKVDKVAVSAVTLTPIASLSQSSSNCPEALGGSCNVAGGLYADTVRIDIYARTGSSTATLNLIEYYRDDSRWVIHGSDCTVTTALTLCRYITKRGNRHWHVYKSAGTTAYVAIDEVSGPSAGLGSIEPGAGGGSGPALSDAAPSALGVAASGSSGDASRDHERDEDGADLAQRA